MKALAKLILGGCIVALLFTLIFTTWAYFLICLGFHPESVDVSGLCAPLLALFCVGAIAGSLPKGGGKKRWLSGFFPAAAMVLLWLAVWFYFSGRFSPADWWHAGVAKAFHLREWTLAIFAGVSGSIGGVWLAERTSARTTTLTAVGLALATLTGVQFFSSQQWGHETGMKAKMAAEIGQPQPDGTTMRLFTFDFVAHPNLRLRLYDADSDDRIAFDDTNSSYMGQGIDLIGAKLDRAARAQGAQLLLAINSGFFGAREHRVAFHEAPVVIDGTSHYNVDLIRPKDQAWVFAVSSPDQIRAGTPRFRLAPEISWEELGKYQTALAGVRPLRVDGRSLELKPGIGSTKLRCARTSIGWSANGDTLYVLIVRDPDTEGASNLQRRGQIPQTGGWDVGEVQAFWEKQGVPNAILLDGGESTQAVYRNAQGDLTFLRAGYHWGIPLGHLGGRPLAAFPAMLPRLQNCRGVLNYLYVEAASH
jgi:hypothetical protein